MVVEVEDLFTSGYWVSKRLLRTRNGDFVKPEECPPPVNHPFINYLHRFQVGKAGNNDDNVVRTIGSLGLFYMWSVPIDEQHAMLTKYAKAVREAKQDGLCIDEKLTDTFRLFADLDMSFSKLSELFKPVEVVDNTESTVTSFGWVKHICDIVSEIVRTVSSFYPEICNLPNIPSLTDNFVGDYDHNLGEWTGSNKGNGRLRCMCSIVPPCLKKDDTGKEKVKIGVHLNWIGNIRVDREQAMQIWRLITYNLEVRFGARRAFLDENAWEDVVDRQVYTKAGGIRMLGSWKAVKCNCLAATRKHTLPKKVPKSKIGEQVQLFTSADAYCDRCLSRGKMLQKRIYLPEWVFSWDGKIDSSMNYLLDPHNIHEQVLAASIRTNVITTTREFRPSDVVKTTQNVTQKKANITANKTAKPVVSSGQCLTHQTYDIGADETRLALDVVRNFHSEYEQVLARSFKRRSKLIFELEPKGFGSNFCLNVNRAHTSNNVYFLITPNGLYQRCRSKKVCAQFSSAKKPISQQLVNLLFGNLKDKRRTTDPSTRPDVTSQAPNAASLMYKAELIRILESKAQMYFPNEFRGEQIKTLSKQSQEGKQTRKRPWPGQTKDEHLPKPKHRTIHATSSYSRKSNKGSANKKTNPEEISWSRKVRWTF